jgi:Trypsin-like peptidase domain
MCRTVWLVAMTLIGIHTGLLPMILLAVEEQPKLPTYLSRLYQRKPYTLEDLADYAAMFTVEILAKDPKRVGSGILLEQQGDVYTVLTAGHVLNAETSFTIKTADGKVHRVVANSVKLAKHGVDLGLLKFQSSNRYELVGIGSSNTLSIGSPVYVAGYPGESSVIESGKFNCTKGEIITKNDGNSKGYSLVYSNITRPGMSGGPVLNEYGRLVAVHGQGEREENTAKTGRNLGISIERFGLVALDMGVSEDLPIPTLSRSTSYRASEYFLKAQETYRRSSSEALKFYDRAIAIDPKFIAAYLGRAEIKGFWLRNIQGEIDDYSKIIAIDPKFADAYYRRGLRRKDLKNNAAAIQDFRQAAKLYKAQGDTKQLKRTLRELRELGSPEN